MVPVYNEEEILKSTVARLGETLRARYGEEYEIILSDDGSTDASPLYEAEAGASSPRIKIVCAEKNFGKGHAVRAGVLAAEGDFILFTDCDLAYGTDVIPAFFDALEKEADVDFLCGSRAAHPAGYAGYGFTRKLLSRGYLRVVQLVGGLPVRDTQTGIKAFRRAPAHDVFSRCEIDRFAFDAEIILLAANSGYTVKEYPVKMLENRPSSIHFFRDTAKMLRDIIRLRKRMRKEKTESNIR